jgi:hypothetical protein
VSPVLKLIRYADADIFPYDIEDKDHINKYLEGEEYDSKGEFLISSDTWKAWRYAHERRPTDSPNYTFRFTNLRSPLKPFVKRYCKEVLLDGDRPISGGQPYLPYALRPADDFLVMRGCTSLYTLRDPDVFQVLWDSLITDRSGADAQGRYPMGAVARQQSTRHFWLWLSRNYGIPKYVPQVAPHFRPKPVEMANDQSKVLPNVVIKQLVNKLAAHRYGLDRLNPYNHLRLCVLILTIATGRRIDEILSTHRGTKRHPVLLRELARGASMEGALWLRFHPNKGGLSEHVYISPEWEDVTVYCVDELGRYGDQVRSFAKPEESHLLILVSTWNWTRGPKFRDAIVPAEDQDFTKAGSQGSTYGLHSPRHTYFKKHAYALSYHSLYYWLNGCRTATKQYYSVMHQWKITIDGLPEGEIYKLCTHFARHTRQTVLASNPQIPIITRQRDLNHTDRNMQVHYQHQGKEQNERLLERMHEGGLFGKAAEAFREIPELEMLGGAGLDISEPRTKFQPGRPRIMDERWSGLYKEHRRLIENAARVPGGICSKPDGGPRGCKEYMNCMNAHEGGCAHFCTDPNDPEMMDEVFDTACELRDKQQVSEAAGRAVQAGKEEVLARRAEEFRDEALKRSPPEVVARLKMRLQTIKERGI